MKRDTCRYNQTRGMKDFKTICIYGIKIEEGKGEVNEVQKEASSN